MERDDAGMDSAKFDGYAALSSFNSPWAQTALSVHLFCFLRVFVG